MIKRCKPILMICIVALAVFIIALFRMKSQRKIPEKPEDTALEFWITEDVGRTDFSGFDEPYGMFGGKAYLGRDYSLQQNNGHTEVPKEHVIYTVTAWPDYADGGNYVTKIEITDPAVTVYGLTSRSSFEEFDDLLQKQGYALQTVKNEFRETHQAEKNGFVFCLEKGVFTENGEMESLFTISVKVSNRENICF